jgi:hypothetical protein
MRTLAGALTTAQRALSRVPYLKTVISTRFANIRTPTWSTTYSGAEPDGPHAAAITTDYYMTLLRVDANTLYRQRILSSSVMGWGSWTSWRAATRLCALARYGLYLWAYAVDNATPTQVYMATSTDGGANWSAFALAFTHTSTITHIAAAAKSATAQCVIVNDGTNIAAYRCLSTVWQAKVVSTTTALTLTGLAMMYGYGPDWNCLATGADATDAKLVRQIFGDGYSQGTATWSTPITIVSAAVASAVTFHAPNVACPDVIRASFRERYTGTGAYDRIMTTNMPATADFVNNQWREPAPFNLDQDYGLAMPYSASLIFLTCANRVFRAPLESDTIDVTADIITAVITETSLEPAISTIVLDNANGQYNTLGSGPNVAIRKGAQVQVSPGYDALSSDGPALWIVGLRHDYPPDGRATLSILMGDAWHFFDRWASSRTYSWPQTKSIYQIMSWLLARVAFEASSLGSTSSALANLTPDFTVHPAFDPPPYIAGYTIEVWSPWRYDPKHHQGDWWRVPIWVDPPPIAAWMEMPTFASGLAAIRRLLARVPDRLLTRAGHIYIKWPQASEASAASYAFDHNPATQHEISAATYRDDLKDANHDRVFGGVLGDVLGEALDWTEIPLSYSAARHHADPYLTTAAQASDRAAAEQRTATLEATADHIVAPVHCGLEVLDVIDITDARRGLTAAKRRVRALTLVYERGKGAAYNHLITLGQP